MVLSNPGNAHVSGIAGIAQEPLSMTSRLMAQLLGFALRKLSSSSWTARIPSVVVDAIKLACGGVAHKARGALSGLSRQRHGRWCRVRAPSSARRSRPSDLSQPYMYVTHMCT